MSDGKENENGNKIDKIVIGNKSNWFVFYGEWPTGGGDTSNTIQIVTYQQQLEEFKIVFPSFQLKEKPNFKTDYIANFLISFSADLRGFSELSLVRFRPMFETVASWIRLSDQIANEKLEGALTVEHLEAIKDHCLYLKALDKYQALTIDAMFLYRSSDTGKLQILCLDPVEKGTEKNEENLVRTLISLLNQIYYRWSLIRYLLADNVDYENKEKGIKNSNDVQMWLISHIPPEYIGQVYFNSAGETSDSKLYYNSTRLSVINSIDKHTTLSMETFKAKFQMYDFKINENQLVFPQKFSDFDHDNINDTTNFITCTNNYKNYAWLIRWFIYNYFKSIDPKRPAGFLQSGSRDEIDSTAINLMVKALNDYVTHYGEMSKQIEQLKQEFTEQVQNAREINAQSAREINAQSAREINAQSNLPIDVDVDKSNLPIDVDVDKDSEFVLCSSHQRSSHQHDDDDDDGGGNTPVKQVVDAKSASDFQKEVAIAKQDMLDITQMSKNIEELYHAYTDLVQNARDAANSSLPIKVDANTFVKSDLDPLAPRSEHQQDVETAKREILAEMKAEMKAELAELRRQVMIMRNEAQSSVNDMLAKIKENISNTTEMVEYIQSEVLKSRVVMSTYVKEMVTYKAEMAAYNAELNNSNLNVAVSRDDVLRDDIARIGSLEIELNTILTLAHDHTSKLSKLKEFMASNPKNKIETDIETMTEYKSKIDELTLRLKVVDIEKMTGQINEIDLQNPKVTEYLAKLNEVDFVDQDVIEQIKTINWSDVLSLVKIVENSSSLKNITFDQIENLSNLGSILDKLNIVKAFLNTSDSNLNESLRVIGQFPKMREDLLQVEVFYTQYGKYSEMIRNFTNLSEHNMHEMGKFVTFVRDKMPDTSDLLSRVNTVDEQIKKSVSDAIYKLDIFDKMVLEKDKYIETFKNYPWSNIIQFNTNVLKHQLQIDSFNATADSALMNKLAEFANYVNTLWFPNHDSIVSFLNIVNDNTNNIHQIKQINLTTWTNVANFTKSFKAESDNIDTFNKVSKDAWASLAKFTKSFETKSDNIDKFNKVTEYKWGSLAQFADAFEDRSNKIDKFNKMNTSGDITKMTEMVAFYKKHELTITKFNTNTFDDHVTSVMNVDRRYIDNKTEIEKIELRTDHEFTDAVKNVTKFTTFYFETTDDENESIEALLKSALSDVIQLPKKLHKIKTLKAIYDKYKEMNENQLDAQFYKIRMLDQLYYDFKDMMDNIPDVGAKLRTLKDVVNDSKNKSTTRSASHGQTQLPSTSANLTKNDSDGEYQTDHTDHNDSASPVLKRKPPIPQAKKPTTTTKGKGKSPNYNETGLPAASVLKLTTTQQLKRAKNINDDPPVTHGHAESDSAEAKRSKADEIIDNSYTVKIESDDEISDKSKPLTIQFSEFDSMEHGQEVVTKLLDNIASVNPNGIDMSEEELHAQREMQIDLRYNHVPLNIDASSSRQTSAVKPMIPRHVK